MEYIYIAPPPKPREEKKEQARCPLSTDHDWAKYMVHREYFLSMRHALEFLESWRPLSEPRDIASNEIFTKINVNDPPT